MTSTVPSFMVSMCVSRECSNSNGNQLLPAINILEMTPTVDGGRLVGWWVGGLVKLRRRLSPVAACQGHCSHYSPQRNAHTILTEAEASFLWLFFFCGKHFAASMSEGSSQTDRFRKCCSICQTLARRAVHKMNNFSIQLLISTWCLDMSAAKYAIGDGKSGSAECLIVFSWRQEAATRIKFNVCSKSQPWK